MAARTTKGARKGEMPDSWKDKSRIAALANRLRDHADGKIELSSTQIKAAEILLAKTVPNLSSIEQHNIDERDKLSEDQIVSTLQSIILGSPGVVDSLLRIIIQADPGAVDRARVAQPLPSLEAPTEQPTVQ